MGSKSKKIKKLKKCLKKATLAYVILGNKYAEEKRRNSPQPGSN